MKVQIGSLQITVDSMDELDQLIQRYGSTPHVAVTSRASDISASVISNSVSNVNNERTPLEARRNELCEQHGEVFVIHPKDTVTVGQRIKWGKPREEKTVEIIESAELPGKDRAIVQGRWFAKLVDV